MSTISSLLYSFASNICTAAIHLFHHHFYPYTIFDFLFNTPLWRPYNCICHMRMREKPNKTREMLEKKRELSLNSDGVSGCVCESVVSHKIGFIHFATHSCIRHWTTKKGEKNANIAHWPLFFSSPWLVRQTTCWVQSEGCAIKRTKAKTFTSYEKIRKLLKKHCRIPSGVPENIKVMFVVFRMNGQ